MPEPCPICDVETDAFYFCIQCSNALCIACVAHYPCDICLHSFCLYCAEEHDCTHFSYP